MMACSCGGDGRLCWWFAVVLCYLWLWFLVVICGSSLWWSTVVVCGAGGL